MLSRTRGPVRMYVAPDPFHYETERDYTPDDERRDWRIATAAHEQVAQGLTLMSNGESLDDYHRRCKEQRLHG